MSKEQKQSYYEYITANDILHFFKNLQGWRLRESDGKLTADHTIATESPWHHVRHFPGFDCGLWHRVLFDLIGQQLGPEGIFVPSKCQECWKVVVRPQTVLGLFALLELQKKLDRPSKCGIETRDTVHGLYGGYFYNASLEQGLECWQTVREAVNETEHLGPEITVLLKRACTEYEMACGPSDQWVITEHQLAIEYLVETCIAKDDIIREQPEWLVRAVHRRWIEWAYAAGDPTYSHFTNGQPLHPAYVTYQHLLGKDMPPRDSKGRFLKLK